MVKFAGFLKRLKQAKDIAKNVIGTMKQFYDKAKPFINEVFKIIPDKYVGIADSINSAVDTGLTVADKLRQLDPTEGPSPKFSTFNAPASDVLRTFNKPINM